MTLVYQLIKTKESEGASRVEIMEEVTQNYGEDNPDVSTKIVQKFCSSSRRINA